MAWPNGTGVVVPAPASAPLSFPLCTADKRLNTPPPARELMAHMAARVGKCSALLWERETATEYHTTRQQKAVGMRFVQKKIRGGRGV